MRTMHKHKKYGALEQLLVIWMSIAIAGFFVAMCSIAVWALNCYRSEKNDPNWLVLAGMFGAMAIVWLGMFIKTGYIKRLALHFRFSPDGIHCSGLMWGRFTVP